MIKLTDFFIRKIEKKDSPLILTWRNLDNIRASMFNSNIISEDEHEKWFCNLANNNDIDYQIVEYKCKPIGLVYFTDINRGHMRAFWGFYLGEQGLPKYSGLLMGLFSLEYFFNKYKFHKIYGEVISNNKISSAYHEKLGFVKEGYFSEHIIRDGNYQDVIRYALYNEQWQKHKVNIIKLVEG